MTGALHVSAPVITIIIIAIGADTDLKLMGTNSGAGKISRVLLNGKVKIKVHTLDIAPIRSESPSQKH